MYKFITTILLCIVTIHVSFAQAINQNRKKLAATRVTSPPKIDGVLKDDAWKEAPYAQNFIMMRPDNGKPEPATHKTAVKLVYDDNAVYISAKMYAPDPKKIPAEFTNRDNIGNADFFIITINPNDDGQNSFQFIVTSSGAQADAKVSNGNEDFNWSAVWESDFSITQDAWIVEMKIPYRALRFANVPVQSWGINFHRRVQNLNAQFTWNHIDNQQGIWTQYDGLYENFTNLKPPTRLNFYPYASAITTTKNGSTDFDWSVGMDVKYGITENFTLDATLIPDFSQVGFDNVTLNLGPFEQQFTEQRQFFTEGTELFSKGGLFYSRRIGASPIDQFASERQNDDEFTNGKKVNEHITKIDDKVQMLNAIKVSGRTKKGLGIGVFNAITKKSEATVTRTEQTINGLDTLSNTTTYQTVVNPFSNYNIMVLDQQFNQNSSVTLINTNVTRDGRFRDANVTGLLWHLEDKKSTYNIDGSFKMSNIYDDVNYPNTGYTFDTSIGKHAGNWRGEIGYNFENKDYNPNDMGILFSNNEQTLYGFVGYNLLTPKGRFNEYNINLRYNVSFLHNPGTYIGTFTQLSFFGMTKERFAFGGNISYRTERKDFFEPRQGTTSGIYFKRPERITVNHWGSTDYRKKFAIDYNWFYSYFSNHPKEGYGFRISPRYRFTNRFSMAYDFRYNKTNNDQGYVTKINENHIEQNPLLAPLENDIIFGQRDWATYNNSLTGKYTFNTDSAISLSFRHNWSKVPYQGKFFSLNENNGELVVNNYNENHDTNFNSWNLDLNYQWQFAPGSQLIAFYRNSIFGYNDDTSHDFFTNIDSLFDEDNQHTFSLRLVYFIDYNNLKKVF